MNRNYFYGEKMGGYMPVKKVSAFGRVARGAIMHVVLCAAALFLLSGCGGGFGADSGNASELGPGIFEPDTGQFLKF